MIQKILLAILVLLSSCNISYALTQWCDNANIIGCWDIETGSGTTMVDASTNDFDGTLVGTVTWDSTETAEDAPGSFFKGTSNYSLNFEDSDAQEDTVYVDMSTQINLSGDTLFSYVAWVKYDSSRSDEHTMVSSWETVADQASILFRLEPSNDTIEAFVVVESNTTKDITVNHDTITANVWHHVAITFNSSGNLSGYIDGVKDTDTTVVGAAFDSSNSPQMWMGETPHLMRDWLEGNLDEVAMFNLELDSTDINDIYENGLAQSSVTTSLYNSTIYDATLYGE